MRGQVARQGDRGDPGVGFVETAPLALQLDPDVCIGPGGRLVEGKNVEPGEGDVLDRCARRTLPRFFAP